MNPQHSSIPAHDLAGDMTALASRALAQQLAAQAKSYSPLRAGLSPAEMAARHARNQEAQLQRERRISVLLGEALADWEITRAALAGNRPALAALNVHQPQRGYEGAVCSECRESEFDDTVPVAWPCGTYTAIKREAGT